MLGAQGRPRVDDRRIAVIDAGKTSTRAAAFREGALLDRRSTARGVPHPEVPGAVESVLEGVDEVLGPLDHGPYDVLVLAATGIRRIGPAESRLRAALSNRWGCEVILGNDVIAAHLGAFGARPGILAQAGTGSVVVAATEEGAAMLDGWGHLAGDRGSGFALGRAGLRAAFAALDGTGPATVLAPLIVGEDPEGTVRALYASSTRTRDVAALAPLVLDAADDGDRAALHAVDAVAGELVALIHAGHRRSAASQPDPLPVIGVGGLFESPRFRGTVENALHEHLPRLALRDGTADALEGGRLLATASHEPLIRRLACAFGTGSAVGADPAGRADSTTRTDSTVRSEEP